MHILKCFIMAFCTTFAVWAEAETITLKASEVATQHEEGSDEWFIGFYTDDMDYGVQLAYTSNQQNGTFDYDQMLEGQTYIQDFGNGGQYIEPKTGSRFTVAASADGALDVTGKLLGEDGITYVLDAHQAAPTAMTDTLDLDVTATEVHLMDAAYQGSCYIGRTASPDRVVSVCVQGLLGNYSGKKVVAKHTYVLNEETGEKASYTDGEAVVTTDASHLMRIELGMQATDSVYYRIHMTYQMPAATDTVRIEATNLKLTDHVADWGMYWVNASTAEYSVEYQVLASEIVSEEISNVQRLAASIKENATGKTAKDRIVDRCVVTWDEAARAPFIESALLGNDGKYYELSLRFEYPKSADTVDLYFDDAQYVNRLSNDLEQVAGNDRETEYYLTIAASTSEVEGEFSLEDESLIENYTYLFVIAEQYKIGFVEAKATFRMSGDSVYVEAEALGENSVLYRLHMRALYTGRYYHMDYDATPEDGGVDRVFTTANSKMVVKDDNLDEYGVVYLDIEARDGMEGALLEFFVPNGDAEIVLPPGTYTVSDSEDPFTLMANPGVAGGNIYASFYGTIDPDGYYNVPLWFISSGECVVENRGGYLYVEVNARNSYDVPVHIVYDGTPTALEQTVAADAPRKLLLNGHILIQNPSGRFTLLGEKVNQ